MNACLGLFLVSGVLLVVDDSIALAFGHPLMPVIGGILSFFAILTAVLVYFLMGLTPVIPKRVFLPVTLFYLAGLLVMFPIMIYYRNWLFDDWYRRSLEIDWIISLCQVMVGLFILYCLRGGFKFRWSLIEDRHLGQRLFSWRNLIIFLLANIFLLVPALAAFLYFSAVTAVDRFSGGFMAVHSNGLTVRVTTYVRDDGRTIELVPMQHIASADFYHDLSQSFSTNAVVLMEGVTDRKHLLTNGISYKRMAHSLGMVEQVRNFHPKGRVIRADIDVDQFSTNTIDLLNVVMLIHTQGVNANTLTKLTQFSAPPQFERQLEDDLVEKRNRHVLGEIRTWVARSNDVVVPWGVGHMPGLASAIQKDGFRLQQTRDYYVFRFHNADSPRVPVSQ